MAVYMSCLFDVDSQAPLRAGSPSSWSAANELRMHHLLLHADLLEASLQLTSDPAAEASDHA